MLNFSGVHGTVSQCADNIQHIGFIIDNCEEYKRMFGNAVYMYKNDENGKLYAKKWAKSKIQKENLIGECEVLLFIDFNYESGECITWTNDRELEFQDWLNKHKREITSGNLTRKIQNEWRLIMISNAVQGMKDRYKVIFANMPLPRELSNYGRNRYSACAVKDSCILPKPPYRQE